MTTIDASDVPTTAQGFDFDTPVDRTGTGSLKWECCG